MDCHSLLQGIFPTEALNLCLLGLLHCRSHQSKTLSLFICFYKVSMGCYHQGFLHHWLKFGKQKSCTITVISFPIGPEVRGRNMILVALDVKVKINVYNQTHQTSPPSVLCPIKTKDFSNSCHHQNYMILSNIRFILPQKSTKISNIMVSTHFQTYDITLCVICILTDC